MKQVISFVKQLNRQRNIKTKELKRRFKLLRASKNIKDNRDKEIDMNSVSRILFPFVDLGIGDAVCHTGIWRELKQAGYTLQIIAEERNRDLFEKMTFIDEVYIVNLNDIPSLPMIDTDLVISHYSWMKRKELFDVQLLQRVNYKYAINFGGWLKKPWNKTLPITNDFHITHPQRDILKVLGIASDDLLYSLSVPLKHDSFITDYLASYEYEKIVVINPFASVEERSLSPAQLEKMATLVSQQDNAHVFIVGEARKLSALHFTSDKITVCKFNSLWDAIALMEKADLVISVDTAMVHIACALNKKLIGIYYSMLLDHNSAYQGNIIFAPVGENAHQLIFDRHNNKLNVERIVDKAHTLLNS